MNVICSAILGAYSGERYKTITLSRKTSSRPSGEGTEGFRDVLYRALRNGKLFLAQTQQMQHERQEGYMDIGAQNKTDRKDRPLTREDVEQLLQQAGSPDELNLTGMNLQEIDLRGFNLAGAILYNADLRGVNLIKTNLSDANLSDANLSDAILAKANLSGAILTKANLSGAILTNTNLSGAILAKATLYGAVLSGADLSEANLSGANLSGANLSEAILGFADLRGTNLFGANLNRAFLFGADLSGAFLFGADLSGANLREADLSGADLRNAKLNEAVLRGAYLTDAKIDVRQLDKALLDDEILVHNVPILGALSKDQDFFRQKVKFTTEEWPIAAGIIPIRITEKPLTPYNLAIALTALTELTTKFWLIAKRRFDDLIEYTQTHDGRFAKEAGATIAYARYNSPFNFGFQVDKLVPSVADATMTVVNGLTQRKAKLEQLELENQAAAKKIKEAEQKARQEQQMAALELEKQRLAIEKERQALVEQRLDAQKKRIEDSLELANKAVDIVYPNVDAEMRSVLIQTIMNNILQLQNVTGLELALPPPKKEEEK